MSDWLPSRSTKEAVRNFVAELLSRLPVLLGIDETIVGCELVNLDTFGVGLTVIPRYVTVKLRGYNQFVWYNGVVGLTIGDYYTVIHIREGDRYEILGPSGTGGSSGGSYTAPASTYQRIVIDSQTQEVVVDSVTGEVVTI